MDRTLLTAEQVAEILGVSKWFVRQLYLRGDLKALRLGHKVIRFDPRDVDTYIRRLRRDK